MINSRSHRSFECTASLRTISASTVMLIEVMKYKVYSEGTKVERYHVDGLLVAPVLTSPCSPPVEATVFGLILNSAKPAAPQLDTRYD